MAQQKKGLITRLLEGKEKSEEYARSTLPTNRWQLFWDIFKGNFGKIVKVNLLTLLFFIPLLIVIVMGILYSESVGITYPFGANLGIGYPAAPDMQGVSESLSLQGDLYMYFGVFLTSIIAAVGLSGGMYVIRNMVWTEGIFVTNDFWRGVKLNFKNALQTALFFCMVLLINTLLINIAELSLTADTLGKGQKVMFQISLVVSYLFLALAAMMSFWMIALGVNYKMGFLVMFRNSFLMTIGTLPQTVFFGALALLPFALLLFGVNLLTVIGIMMILLFGIAYALLVWLDFAQWVFDKYINPKIEGAKVGRGIYNKDGTSTLTGDDSAASVEYQRMLLSHGRSRLVARPIKPIDDSMQVYELPQSFTREDLKKLRESKENIMEDTEAYAEEHKNDLRYVEYNRQFDEREKALQEEDEKKGKKKRGKKLKASKKPEDDEDEEE
ncbi:MAG: hypothetical protein J6B05_04260 [Clostridia bacterium]|nr:hypothetical protein [Clostridia bacterium]